MSPKLTRARTLPLIMLLAACSGYDIRVNEQVVYQPAPIFRNYQIPDAALASCVRQHLLDAHITSAAGLRVLNCSQAGVESIDGLAVFFALERLKLSGNRIDNISSLGALTALVELQLDGNRLLDIGILHNFEALQSLDLSANSGLICPPSGALAGVSELTLPDHCAPDRH